MRNGTLTFSMQLSVGIKLYCWKMNPMFAARNCVTAFLSMRCNGESNTSTSPRSAPSVPAMTLSNVVLPHPDGPTSMSNSPMRASKLTSFKTSVRVSPSPNPLHTVLVLTAMFCINCFLFFVTRIVVTPSWKVENSADTGVIKNGAGTMKLTGPNTYTGPTIINSGRYLVDGSLSPFTVVTVNSTATLGGTGIVGGVTFNAGSFAQLTLGSPLKLTESLTAATVGTLPVVKVNLTNNVAPGTYPLAIHNVTGSSGAFDSTPIILSGSVAVGNVATITTGSGVVSLVVAPPTSNPTLNYSIGSGKITFTWTGAFKLVAQTNSLSVGLGTVWFDYPGGSTSGIAVPIDPANPAVFLRLQSLP